MTNGVSTGPSSQTKAIAAAPSAVQLRMRRCAAFNGIAAPAWAGPRPWSMQARRIAVVELEQPLLDLAAIVRVRDVLQVRRQVCHGRLDHAELRRCEAAVAPLLPGFGEEDDEPLLHGVQARPVVGAAMDLLQVAQHAGDDLARRRRLQEERE